MIRDDGSRRNQAYVWEAVNESAAAWHEKYYLPDEEGCFENSWYDCGTQDFTVARGAGMKLGVQICTKCDFSNGRGIMPVPASIYCWCRVQACMRPLKNGLPAGRRRLSVPVPIAYHPTCGALQPRRPTSAVLDG